MQSPNPAGTAGRNPCRSFALGELIHAAGTPGTAWRIRSGAVRLDRDGSGEHRFAGLALAGDILGAESLIYGTYAFDARALGDVELEPWLEGGAAPTGESLLQILASFERRAAETLALRAGEAFDRVRQLMLMLARDRGDGRRQVLIPGLRDMAEITGLTVETVSRAMSRLRKAGQLQKHGRRFGLVIAEPVPANP